MAFIKILKNTTQKILMVFDDMICLVMKKPNSEIAEFIRERILNISLVFITQLFFAVSKNIRLNLTHYFVMKIPNKRELKQIAFNHSSDIDFQDFLNIYKKSTAKSYSFFWLLILLLHQKNLNVSERIF